MVDRVETSDVEFAHELASAADQVALRFAGGEVRYRSKADGTPVSDADLAAEEAMLALLSRYRPADGVISEERGAVGASSERRWILDPIDGTAQFVVGGEEWGTHVALEVAGEIVLGIITRPTRQQRWWAARGHGAYTDTDRHPFAGSQPLATSVMPTLEGARIGLYRQTASRLPELLGGLGVEVAPHGASHIIDLIEGSIDGIVSERCGFLWDHAPAVVLTVEAGGRFCDPDGGVRADLQGGIYSNAELHDHLWSVVTDGGVELTNRISS